jgi:cytochrome P450
MREKTEEVRDAFTTVEETVSRPLLSGCHYLRAYVDKAQRHSPFVTTILPRTVLAGGIEIDGDYIDAGTEVGASIYDIHHNEEYYPASFRYLPDRWIAADSSTREKAKVDTTHKAFAAFSLGLRGFIGKNIPYVTLMTALARILFRFEMRLRSNLGEGDPDLGQRKDEFQLTDQFNGYREGPIVELHAVKP